MTFRRLCSLVALGALLLSSGCCWHERCCCHRPILFPRIREACYERRCGCERCGAPTCATCCHGSELMGPPLPSSAEPIIAPIPLPMPRPATPLTPMKPVN
jgi:hypothetical protein